MYFILVYLKNIFYKALSFTSDRSLRALILKEYDQRYGKNIDRVLNNT